MNTCDVNILSLFDGMSCGRLALDRINFKYSKYYCSEIDKFALSVAINNYPDSIYLGDVLNFKDWFESKPNIFLLMGGSPCQSISGLGNKKGLLGESRLFYTYLECLKYFKPKYFLLENVLGNKESIEEISRLLGVNPIKINSSLFSGQNRNRLYWTNIDIIRLPENKNISLFDILEDGVPEDSLIGEGRKKWLFTPGGKRSLSKKYSSINSYKAQCLTKGAEKSWTSNYVYRSYFIESLKPFSYSRNFLLDDFKKNIEVINSNICNLELTRLTPNEYERLQTVPDNYTSGVSNSQRYKMLGNGWTVDVIAYILKHMK